MNEDFRRLLESCDEEGAYEFPKDFDYRTLERDALLVESALLDQIGIKTRFEDGGYNQDASFSVAIILVDYMRQDGAYRCEPTLRFSNFGRLCSLTWSNFVPIDVLKKIFGILVEAGFHYIPEEVLSAEYDGVMKGNESLPTWWIRYFDWI